ncbi:hypothetical protein Q2941_14550 [Bradyrhizobium sp. UFLA05-153]|uniref:hypothetical protein n=1 Tax=Bradyrhizobium sp. Ec3.3 TaxID=189753 RepID=UPI0003FAA769|nr:hypothetical protein [Bradyrhizobium sp. Ec3.3]
MLATNLAVIAGRTFNCHPTVIARLARSCALERAIQYSSDVRRMRRSRRVLDFPLAAYAKALA